MDYKGLTLDNFQEEAINEILSNNSVVVSAPTGSGKTLIADFIIEQELKKGKKVVYTAPIKALSNQKYKDFCHDYGKENIGLITGDIVINHDAQILVMTTEVYRNMVLTHDADVENVSYVIFDEIHYINDIERGYVWEESIIFSPESVRFLCLSATIPNAQEFSDWISSIKKHKIKTIVHTERPVPLSHYFYDAELGFTTLERIKLEKETPRYEQVMGRGKQRFRKFLEPNHIELVQEIFDRLPCLFFCFSRNSVEKNAEALARKNFFQVNPDIVLRIREKFKDIKGINQLKSVQILKETLPKGIGFHHAGLLPIVKELIEELFGKGLIKVLYATETFAVGINMPAKTVCFESLRKFDGINFRILNSKEYFQMAGRAGRRGIDKQGFVISMINRRDFEYDKIKRITTKDVEPLESQFRLSVNTVLNLKYRHTQDEIDKILMQSFFTFQQKKQKKGSETIRYIYNKTIKKLINMGYIVENELDYKGKFASQIFVDEILLTEIFATKFSEELDEYQIVLILASLVFEEREKPEYFKQNFKTVKALRHKINKHHYLSKEKRFENIEAMTTIIQPVFSGKTFFEILQICKMTEGDLIRLLGQITDRINQLRRPTSDPVLSKLKNCQHIIEKVLKEVMIV